MHNVGELRQLRERFPNELVIIGVHSAKFPSERLTANIQEAAQRYGIEHPVVNDAGFQVWDLYGVRAWPTVVLIDPRGKIVNTQAGEIDAGEFIPVIEQLIQKYRDQGVLEQAPLETQAGAEAEPETLLRFPTRVVVTPSGQMFLADTGHHRILELQLDSTGFRAEIRRIFGSGQPGFQDGSFDQAGFRQPRGLAISRGKMYVADTGNHAIRAIELEKGQVRTVAGTGEKGRGRAVPGSPTETALRSPWGLAVLTEDEQSEQYLFIAVAGSHQIWLMIDEQRLGVFAGNGREALVDGPLAQASFNQPSDLAFGLGHLLVADPEASAIRAISFGQESKVVTLVGQGLFEFGDVDGTGSGVRLQHPTGIAAHDHIIYIVDSYNHKIKTLDSTTGEVKTLIGSGQSGLEDGNFGEASLYEPEGVAYDNGRLYIADTNNHLIRIADLQEGKLKTLEITGLARLAAAVKPTRAATRLDPVEVAPGQAEIFFDFHLPEGYKLNPDAPVTIQVDGQVQVYQPGEAVKLQIDAGQESEMTLELTLYYCQSQEVRLCLIYDRSLVLPIKTRTDAPSQAHISYPIF